MTLDDLYARPLDEEFTKDEIEFIKANVPKNKYLVKYGTWKQYRHNGKYFFIAIDFMPYATRRAAIDNSIDVYATRKITDEEHQWLSEMYGSFNRKYNMYNYENVEPILNYDKEWNAKTPDDFIRGVERFVHPIDKRLVHR